MYITLLLAVPPPHIQAKKFPHLTLINSTNILYRLKFFYKPKIVYVYYNNIVIDKSFNSCLVNKIVKYDTTNLIPIGQPNHVLVTIF